MYLNVESKRIYYEVSGEGELLILIHGVITDSSTFREAARILAGRFRVVTYDRRGNSRSSGSEHFDLEEQAEDIRYLLDKLGTQKAYIVGVSAGAVIGQVFLDRYPERVKHLIMFEPAMLGRMMREDENFKEWSEETRALVNAGKINSALLRFSRHIGPQDERSPSKPEEDSIRELGNLEYAMTLEIPELTAYDPNEKDLIKHADKITIAAGERSADTAYTRAAKRLAALMGREVLYYPGGHNLSYDLPREFAACVTGTIMLQQWLK